MIGFEHFNGPGLTRYSEEEMAKIESKRCPSISYLTSDYKEYRPAVPGPRKDIEDSQKALEKEVHKIVCKEGKYTPYFMKGKINTGAADDDRESLIEFRQNARRKLVAMFEEMGVDLEILENLSLEELRRKERRFYGV